jgi:hypothetical protein
MEMYTNHLLSLLLLSSGLASPRCDWALRELLSEALQTHGDEILQTLSWVDDLVDGERVIRRVHHLGPVEEREETRVEALHAFQSSFRDCPGGELRDLSRGSICQAVAQLIEFLQNIGGSSGEVRRRRRDGGGPHSL